MEQTSVTQESKGFYKLNWLQRIGFGSGWEIKWKSAWVRIKILIY
jgi:hypothetical protein